MVSGGKANAASGLYSTVSGGRENSASAIGAVVGGGTLNLASQQSATGGVGGTNIASGSYATVPGGNCNVASGTYSFAGGLRAHASHEGAFVWADSSGPVFSSDGIDTFNVRATGGAIFVTATDWVGNATETVRFTTSGDVIATGSFNPPSDVNVKTAFGYLASRDVLQRVVAMPIRTWAYRNSPAIRHIGPTAQDFHAAFGLGMDDRHIATVDADGVAPAAIQGLHQVVQGKDREIRSLKRKAAKVDALERDIAQLKSLVKALAEKGR